jgi:hypothetical protein
MAGVVVAPLIAASLIGAGAAQAEEDCPAGQFPSSRRANTCSNVSDFSRLPIDDNRPMVFEAIQDSASQVYVQATGKITPDTPTEFAKFLKSDDGKIVTTSSRIIMLHSPGGDVAAGISLGQMIRKARFNTEIGRTVHLSEAFDNYAYKTAACLSACALAFLGGVDRAYRKQDTYAFGPDVTAQTPGLASYLDRMGVASATLRETSKAERIPMALAQQLRVVSKASDDSAFHADDLDGTPIAWFNFSLRNEQYRGMVSCQDHATILQILDVDGALPDEFQRLKDTPAEFKDGDGNTHPAKATYIKGGSRSDDIIRFDVTWLGATSFSGRGLQLWTIDNPGAEGPWPANAQADLATRMAWADRVTAFSFLIRSRNAKSVLPAVLKACDFH